MLRNSLESTVLKGRPCGTTFCRPEPDIRVTQEQRIQRWPAERNGRKHFMAFIATATRNR